VRIGIALPSIGRHASKESIDAAVSTAQRLGWTSAWVADHMLVPRGAEADEYGTILEALTTLSYVAARTESLTIGVGVVVPAMRDAPQLAKELATLDILSEGRLIVGVGASDRGDLQEYRNLGKEDRFDVRGAYLDESIALWRHLWGGATEPFHGTFHQLDDFNFRPLPPQGASLPIWCGGRSGRAMRRTAALADGYHAAQTGPEQLRERLPVLQQAVAERGRPMPALSVRARVRFDAEPGPVYSLCGSHENMQRDVIAMAELGVEDLVVLVEDGHPDALVRLAERFEYEVVAPAREASAAAAGRT
jgi:probable F420-dependent oxidoreductase